jgi:hypothetical protein
MKNLLKMLILFVALVPMACEDDNVNTDDELDLSNLTFENFPPMLGPVKVSLKEYPLEKIFADLAAEILSDDLGASSDSKSRINGDESLIGVDLTIYEETEEVLITPLTGTISDGDDEKCGGKKGDGWKFYGSCLSETCVKNTLEKAGEDQGEPAAGKCLELRVRRTTAEAKICGRTIDY